jgi:hypothetical protein
MITKRVFFVDLRAMPFWLNALPAQGEGRSRQKYLKYF